TLSVSWSHYRSVDIGRINHHVVNVEKINFRLPKRER
ncbi:hypothetical protein, partial [Escherichia sp. TW09231]